MERVFVLAAVLCWVLWMPCIIAFLVVYIPMLVTASPPPMGLPDFKALLPVAIPVHVVVTIVVLVGHGLASRDVRLRFSASPDRRKTWSALVRQTGGVGWVVYVFKHGLKPRPNEEQG